MATPTPWQNRIVGHADVAPDQLLANPANWRVHPKHQQAALGAAISEIGLIQSVIVNQATGHMIDGHLRVELALSRNEPTVPVTYVDLSLDEERKALLSFDPLGALAVADRQQLSGLLATVQTEDESLRAMFTALSKDTGTTPVAFDAHPTAPTCPTCGQKIKTTKKVSVDA